MSWLRNEYQYIKLDSRHSKGSGILDFNFAFRLVSLAPDLLVTFAESPIQESIENLKSHIEVARLYSNLFTEYKNREHIQIHYTFQNLDSPTDQKVAAARQLLVALRRFCCDYDALPFNTPIISLANYQNEEWLDKAGAKILERGKHLFTFEMTLGQMRNKVGITKNPELLKRKFKTTIVKKLAD
jgi:hypothetical protein